MSERENKNNKTEVQKMKLVLTDLPEGCLTHILSLTSPFYLLRASSVCKTLNSIVKSDLVWLNFLPSEFLPIIQSSLPYLSPKQLVLYLCRYYVLFHHSRKSFSLDKWTGKKCYMLGARELLIVAGDNPRCWRWKPLSESRFPEVAELLGVTHLYVTGRISTQLLSPNTTYHMYFSFILEAWSRGFDTSPVKVFVSRIDSNGAYIGGSSYDAPKTFYLKAPLNDVTYDSFEGEDAYEHRRDNGHNWMKIDMGKYFNRLGGEGSVAVLEMTLMGTEVGVHKSGLIVQGIELLPLA